MQFKDELNPKLWNSDNTLKTDVADKCKEIADAFIEYLDVDPDAIKDVVITGSSASYNYTPHSDLDLHLKVDFDKVHEDCPIVQGYLWSLKASFNKDHDIFIYGVPVELYAESIAEDTVHNGLYSLWQEKWIDVPKKIPPTDNDSAVEAKFNEIKEAADRIEDSEVAVELIDKIYAMRKAGLTEVGEFSTENLAFKKLRDEGVLDKLKQMKKEKIDKELSLESYIKPRKVNKKLSIREQSNSNDIELEAKKAGLTVDNISEISDGISYRLKNKYNKIITLEGKNEQEILDKLKHYMDKLGIKECADDVYQNLLTQPYVRQHLIRSVEARQADYPDAKIGDTIIDSDGLIAEYADSLSLEDYNTFDWNKAEDLIFEELNKIEAEYGFGEPVLDESNFIKLNKKLDLLLEEIEEPIEIGTEVTHNKETGKIIGVNVKDKKATVKMDKDKTEKDIDWKELNKVIEEALG